MLKKTVITLLISVISCSTKSGIRVGETVKPTFEEIKLPPSKTKVLKKRVAIATFTTSSPYAQRRVGEDITNILITELAKTDRFIILERERLDAIMAERTLVEKGLIDPATALELGKLLGANAIITGSVSEFGVKTQGKDYLLWRQKSQIAEAKVDIRLFDAENGKILLARSGRGSAYKTTSSFLGMGPRSGYDELLEAQALRAAIMDVVGNLVEELDRLGWSARVAKVDAKKVYLNQGKEAGLKLGDILVIYKKGEAIIDPETKIALGYTESFSGRGEVTDFFGEDNNAILTLLVGDANEGDIAKLSE